MGTALVTGGCGFIGRHLTTLLAQRGYGVRVLDLQDWPDAPAGVEIRKGSILDKATMASAVEGVQLALAPLVTHVEVQLEVIVEKLELVEIWNPARTFAPSGSVTLTARAGLEEDTNFVVPLMTFGLTATAEAATGGRS